jgi:hypothetical protein
LGTSRNGRREAKALLKTIEGVNWQATPEPKKPDSARLDHL